MISKQTITLLNNKKIHIYDNVFNHQERQDLFALVEQAEYKRTNLDLVYYNNQNVDIKWSKLLDPNDPIIRIVGPRYFRDINELKHSPFTVERSYINFSTMDTVDMVHSDCLSDCDTQYTLLHYANWHWELNWHGETIFYDDEGQEIVGACAVKPGRVIIFPGSIPHSARAPSRIAQYPRYTIATKIFF